MRLSEKQRDKFLFAIQGVGAVFMGFFLMAYLGGIPTTVVHHSELVFRIPLTIFGIVLLILVLLAFVLAALSKKSRELS